MTDFGKFKLPTTYKSIEELKKEYDGKAIAMTMSDFIRASDRGSLNPMDGSGIIHNGQTETNLSVWSDEMTIDQMKEYPYVIWYEK